VLLKALLSVTDDFIKPTAIENQKLNK